MNEKKERRNVLAATKNVTIAANNNTGAYQEGIGSNLRKSVQDETNIEKFNETLVDVIRKTQMECRSKQTRKNKKIHRRVVKPNAKKQGNAR